MAVVVGVAVYALVLVVAGGFVGDEIFGRLGFGPADGEIPDGPPHDYVRFVYGVLGAVIIGWMATIAAILRGPFRRRETWAWWAVAGALLLWFVVDTTLSIVLGFMGHALFNTGFLVAMGVPLIPLRPRLR